MIASLHSLRMLLISIYSTIINQSSLNNLMFGISIFQSPEHFLALALGLFLNHNDAVQQLALILPRTKSPPISAVYTYEFLKPKSWSQYGLDVVRFASQLSDLSDGGSVLSSLYKVIGESSFLTQIRHKLTHKTKINDQLIEITRKIILKELKQKYWDENFKRFTESYHIEIEKVKKQHQRIYRNPLTQQMICEIKKYKRPVTAEWLKNQSSNYQFKEFFQEFYEENSQREILDLINQLIPHKKAIALNYLFRKFYYNNKSQELTQLLIRIIKRQNATLFSQNLVFSSLKKLTYLHYLGNCSKVISALPKQALTQLGNYWEGRQKVLEKRESGLKIYKPFKMQDFIRN